jgi:hypothetical protein
MAKVTGPLMSMGARGAIGGAIVFGAWKGINTVRELVIPANPQTEDQGDNRQIVAGIARTASVIGVGSDYHQQMIDLNKIPARQSKQSAAVKFIKNTFCEDATAYEAENTAFQAHAQKAVFTSEALGLGLNDFSVAYSGTEVTFSKGLMLYLLAKAGIGWAFEGVPYTVAIGDWSQANIEALAADLAVPA